MVFKNNEKKNLATQRFDHYALIIVQSPPPLLQPTPEDDQSILIITSELLNRWFFSEPQLINIIVVSRLFMQTLLDCNLRNAKSQTLKWLSSWITVSLWPDIVF